VFEIGLLTLDRNRAGIYLLVRHPHFHSYAGQPIAATSDFELVRQPPLWSLSVRDCVFPNPRRDTEESVRGPWETEPFCPNRFPPILQAFKR